MPPARAAATRGRPSTRPGRGRATPKGKGKLAAKLDRKYGPLTGKQWLIVGGAGAVVVGVLVLRRRNAAGDDGTPFPEDTLGGAGDAEGGGGFLEPGGGGGGIFGDVGLGGLGYEAEGAGGFEDSATVADALLTPGVRLRTRIRTLRVRANRVGGQLARLRQAQRRNPNPVRRQRIARLRERRQRIRAAQRLATGRLTALSQVEPIGQARRARGARPPIIPRTSQRGRPNRPHLRPGAARAAARRAAARGA